MSESSRQLILIDGHGLAYRMFYAIQTEMSTRAGEPTNATYGFTRQLLSLMMGDNPPEFLAVSFDVGATFRDELFDDYKATREKMPDSLRMQIGRIQEVLEAFNIPHLEVPGYEADDVLGTVARLAGEMGVKTLIVTGDKDLLQLVNEHTLVQLPGHRSGEVDLYDVEAVKARFGIEPWQIVDYKALIGDKSDNIPGVAGVGEKTAKKLLQEYGTLESIYEHLDELGTRARNALAAHRDEAELSYTLAKIVTDVPLEFDLEACITHDFNRDKVVQIFQELEFRSFLRQIPGGEADSITPAHGQQLSLFGSADVSAVVSGEPVTETVIIRDEDALGELVALLQSAEGIAFDTETTSTDQMQARLVGISVAVEPGTGYYIPVGHSLSDEEQLPLELVLDRLRPVMTDPDIPKIGHNIKYDAVILDRHGLTVYPLSVDTMIGEWLLPTAAINPRLGLKDLAFTRLGVEMTEITQLIGKGKNQISFDLVSVEKAAPYAAADADMTLQISEPICKELSEEGLEKLFYDIEMPLVPVLAAMEQAGMLVDEDLLRSMSLELGQVIEEKVGQVYEVVGHSFNLNSTQQLSDVLFSELGLPTEGLRRTKSGHYSTAADVLEGLRSQDKSGVIQAILDYRELEKLRSTYVDALPKLINPETGRIHSSFNQTGTVTGRISSSDPNLQNIPVRSDIGRKVRDAFVAAPGHVLIAADYSQVELRVMAHISGDEALRQAFIEDQDIHATTAAAVFNIPLHEVTSNQRSFAKAVNFGLLYGMGAFRLARDSELTLPEAEAFIDTYFKRFPRVKTYLAETKRQAVEEGYVETLLGRKRFFPIFRQKDRSQRTVMQQRAAEREAINMPIQGTAADIIKIAMIQLHDALAEHRLRSRMILQVHDELVLEVPENEAEETAALVRDVMQNAYPLAVPLKVDAHTGLHWGELK